MSSTEERVKNIIVTQLGVKAEEIKNESKFNIESAVGKLRIPYLVVHGEKDTSVEPKNGESLFSWNKNNEIFRVAGGDHTFSSKHPWNSKVLPNELKTVVKKTIDFIIGS